MKVLVIHTKYQQRGGEDTVYENETALLSERGIEVHSLLFNNSKFAGIKFLLSIFNPFSFIKAYRAISLFRPDVVHVHNWFFGASPSIFWASRIKKVPTIYTVHNYRILCPSSVLYHDGKLYLESVSKRFPIRAIRFKLYRKSAWATFWVLVSTRLNFLFWTWNGIDRYICLTTKGKKMLCDSYLRIPLEKVTVKPNFFVEIKSNFELQLFRQRTSKFLFVGRLTEEKGIPILLKAFTESGYPLIIIGEGPLKEYVAEMANLYENIECRGFQPMEEIVSALSTCSALVMPSVCYEPFGLVIIEAFSRGTPVIASNVGAPADLVINGINGLQFEAGNPTDLKKQISFWKELPQQRKDEFYRAARAEYEHYYKKEQNFTTLLEIYQSVINERNE